MTVQRNSSKHSLVSRVTFALTALVAIAVLAVCFTAYEIHKTMGERMIDSLVETEAVRLEQKISPEASKWEVPFERQLGPSMHAWAESDTVRALTMPAALRSLPDGLSRLNAEGRAWHVMVVKARDGRFYVMYDTLNSEVLTQDFGLAMLAIALIFIAFAYLCARRLAKWAVQPIVAITAHLSRWAPGKPQVLGLHSNEGLQLTEAFNRMQDRVDLALADQKEFSSNFNHEVRGPLSLIRTDAELAKRSPASNPDVTLRLERIIRSADQITASLEATYHLAQADQGEYEQVSLKDCVDDVFISMEADAGARKLALHNLVKDNHCETLNRHMLQTVIRNIVSNAIQHAAPCNFEISSIEHGLILNDDGPGVSLADSPHIFDRYYSGRRVDMMPARQHPPRHAEAGLGLAIAERACAIQGWTLELDSRPRESSGVSFLLKFQPPPRTL